MDLDLDAQVVIATQALSVYTRGNPDLFAEWNRIVMLFLHPNVKKFYKSQINRMGTMSKGGNNGNIKS